MTLRLSTISSSYNGSSTHISDGLTLWQCGGNSQITDNFFQDNTDVDLIVGGLTPSGGTCNISNNLILHYDRHAEAGLMLGSFGPNHDTDHSGIQYVVESCGRHDPR